MSHLSELSIQLRKLQSEKNEQANEIDRLQRQLRIMSELKGISIADLQAALQSACEAEAHGELRALMGKLQAKVEGLELGGAGGGARLKTTGEDDDDYGVNMLDRFDQEAASRARAALELRIGELQEIEATLRAELESLYKDSQSMAERNTFLETQLLQQKAQLDQWERRWRAKEEEEMNRTSLVPVATPPPVAGSYNYSEFSAVPNGNSGVPILLHNAPQSEIDAEHERRMIAAESALAGEKQQRALVESQLSSKQKSYDLKLDQYQHRIHFLEEQMHDLEQQLSSLYAAFGIMQKDSYEERQQKEQWKQTLIDSDAAIAKEEREREQKEKYGQRSNNNIPVPKSTSKTNDGRSLTKMLVGPSKTANQLTKAAVKPAAHPPIVKGHLLLLLNKEGEALSPNEEVASPRTKKKMSLKLSRSSSSRNVKPMFKKQYCVLHGANGLYQMRYGETYTGVVTGVHEFITAGCSSIDHSPRSSGQSYGFEVSINANDPEAPVLCCAAETEDDFIMWTAGLTSVIDGSIENSGRRSIEE